MTTDELEKEVARIAKWFFQVDDPRQRECEHAVMGTLRAVHDAAIEEAAVAVENEHKICLPLMCESARKVRALKIGDGR